MGRLRITLVMFVLIGVLAGCSSTDTSSQGNNGDVENTSALCSDQMDNDADGLTDCDDNDCTSFSICSDDEALENTDALCSNGLDDDGDGQTDCDDDDCSLSTAVTVCGTKPESGTVSDVRLFNIDVSTEGRLGFYIDYSERETAGTHTFYIARTHGTEGAVSVDLQTAGDIHTHQSGTIHFADGEAGVKSFTVNVTEDDLAAHAGSGLGEHRIVATLSNPAGGAALHRGEYTRAYGVIDNSTMIASDNNAIFIDFDAGSNGDGTKANPFNNWFDARDQWGLTPTRYIYGKGTAISDGTDMHSNHKVFDEEGANGHLNGTSDTDRLYIRNWPGETWTVTGGEGHAGFFIESGCDYTTFKGITFANLSTAQTRDQCYAFDVRRSTLALTFENMTMSNILAGATSDVGAIHMGGGRGPMGTNVWRIVFTDILKANGTQSQGFEQYDGGMTSIQRCEFYDCLIYEKDSPIDPAFAGLSVRFCITDNGLQLECQGTNDYGNYHIIQGNLFLDGGIFNANSAIFYRKRNDDAVGYKHWDCGNVFVNRGGSNLAPYRSDGGFFDNHLFFNNIFYEGQGFWRLDDLPTSFEYCDYNHGYNVASVGNWLYHYQGSEYKTYESMNSDIGFDSHSDIGGNDPHFTDLATNDVTLKAGSPCIGTGVGGTDKGVYLTGVEVLGADLP